MSDTGFTEKLIELTITLGTGQFGDEVGDTVTISDSRILASIINPGGESMGAAQIRVYGMSAELMNKLTTIGQINRATRVKNTVSVAVGDDNGMQLVFFGVIADAWADYNASPDVPFMIQANAGLDIALKPVNATSYKGNVPIVQIMQDLATEAGLAFEGDVDVSLFNPYLPGTTLNKIRSAARAAGVEYVIDRGTLSIWLVGKSRASDSIPKISADTGMVGYPTLSSKGMTIKALFNQNIKYGADIEVESFIPMANGTWHVYDLGHEISSQMPDGPWFTTIEAYRVEP